MAVRCLVFMQLKRSCTMGVTVVPLQRRLRFRSRRIPQNWRNRRERYQLHQLRGESLYRWVVICVGVDMVTVFLHLFATAILVSGALAAS